MLQQPSPPIRQALVVVNAKKHVPPPKPKEALLLQHLPLLPLHPLLPVQLMPPKVQVVAAFVDVALVLLILLVKLLPPLHQHLQLHPLPKELTNNHLVAVVDLLVAVALISQLIKLSTRKDVKCAVPTTTFIDADSLTAVATSTWLAPTQSLKHKLLLKLALLVSVALVPLANHALLSYVATSPLKANAILVTSAALNMEKMTNEIWWTSRPRTVPVVPSFELKLVTRRLSNNSSTNPLPLILQIVLEVFVDKFRF